jgi:hypothetical protein
VNLRRYFPHQFSALLGVFFTVVCAVATAQNNSGWHISPILFNLEVGDIQPLQLLDVQGRELAATSWSVDNSQLAEIREENGRPVLYPKAAGVVHVVALVEQTTLTREITIWSLEPDRHTPGILYALCSEQSWEA